MQVIESTLYNFGLHPESLVPDGKIHRCHTDAKQKKNRDGWYIIKQVGEHFYCNYGCWVRGEKGRISSLNGSEPKNVEAWEQIRAARLLEQDRIEKENKKRAENFFKDCFTLEGSHAYLDRKNVGNYGLMGRKGCDHLIIPLMDQSGELKSFQTIKISGDKRYMNGEGSKYGCCFPIPGDETVICVCEGYATGASIHDATGYKVLCAMDAGNMRPIAEAAVKRWPNSTVLICADNDHTKESNNGLKTGKKIAADLNLNCVWPTGISGSDFNDMAAELGLESVRSEIMQRDTIEVLTPDDCKGLDGSLCIPDGAIPGGLIEQGLEALEADTLQYSLPLVLTAISRAIAGKISINGVYPNVFNIKVGGTSTGKTSADRKFLRCLDIDGFISVNEIASGAGLWRIIASNPQGMGFFDEVTSLFQRNNTKGGVDMIAESKASALLDVFSRSGETFIKGFGDKKNNITITNPCFSLIGNATPVIFEAIQMRDFETGLMQRFDFWVYDGEIKPKSLLINSQYYSKTKDFVGCLRDIMLKEQPDAGLAGLIKGCVELDATPAAVGYIQEYSDYIVDEANKADSDGMTGFISRRFDLSLKYALIHHAAVKGAKDLYSPIDQADIQYGILIAEMLGGWKSHVLSTKVVSGDFHRDCEVFKDAIRANVKANKPKPTFALLAARRTQLKNWPEKYSESIISVLKKRGEIITKEGRRSTQYFLPKTEMMDE